MPARLFAYPWPKLTALAGLLATTLAAFLLGRFVPYAAAAAWLYLPLLLFVTLRWGRLAGYATTLLADFLVLLVAVPPPLSPLSGDVRDYVELAISTCAMLLGVLLVSSVHDRLLRTERARTAEAEALAELARLGVSGGDADETARQLTQHGCRLLGADYAGIMLRHADGNIMSHSLHGYRHSGAQPGLPLYSGATARALASGETLVVERLGDNPAFPAEDFPKHVAEGGRTLISVPLRGPDGPVGALVFGWRSDVHVSDNRRRFAEAIADHAASILYRAQLTQARDQARVRAETEQSRLTAILDQLPSGVVITDAEGRTVLVNAFAQQLSGGTTVVGHGLQTARPVVEQMPWAEIRDPVTGRLLRTDELAHPRALRGEHVHDFEHVVRRQGESEEVWLRSSAVPLRNAVGDITGAAVVFSDVTRQRTLTRALATSEARLRSLHDAMNCGLLVYDRTGTIVEANEAAKRILGKDVAHWGTHAGVLFHEDGTEVPWEDRPSTVALRTGQVVRDAVINVDRPDGQRRWIRVDAVPLPGEDGQASQVVVSFVDMTPRVAAERALRESEQGYRSLFEQSNDAIVLHDLRGRLIQVNERACELLGYDAPALLSRSLGDLLVDSSPDDLRERMERVLRDGYGRREVQWRHADGAPVDVEISLRLLDAAGDGRVLVVARDITQRKRVEQERERERAYLAALHETSVALVNRLDPHDLIESVVAHVRALISTEHACVYLVDADRQTLTETAGSGIFRGWIGNRLQAGEGPAGIVWQTRRPLAVADYQRWEGRLAGDGRHLIEAVAAVPLLTGGEVVGVIALARTEPAAVFDESEIALLAQFAQLAAIALDNAHLYAAAQREIEERRRMEAAVRGSEARFRRAFDDALIGMAMYAFDGRLIRVNRALRDMLGYSEEELLNTTLPALTHPDDVAAIFERFEELKVGLPRVVPKEKRYLHKDGHVVWVSVTSSTVFDDDGRPAYVIGQLVDITARKRAEAALEHRALHDALTELPNRAFLYERLQDAVHEAQRSAGSFALLFLDLDQFKDVNDALGHRVGDELLRQVSARLQTALRETDTVARLGGDEFAALLTDADSEAAREAAERLLAMLKAPCIVEGHVLHVSASIGAALFPEHATNAETLMRQADIAMYRAKRDQLGYALFSASEVQRHRRAGGWQF